MHAQRTDVRARLARHPKHTQVPRGVVLNHLCLVDGAYAQGALHGRYKRRALEQRACGVRNGDREGEGEGGGSAVREAAVCRAENADTRTLQQERWGRGKLHAARTCESL